METHRVTIEETARNNSGGGGGGSGDGATKIEPVDGASVGAEMEEGAAIAPQSGTGEADVAAGAATTTPTARRALQQHLLGCRERMAKQAEWDR